MTSQRMNAIVSDVAATQVLESYGGARDLLGATVKAEAYNVEITYECDVAVAPRLGDVVVIDVSWERVEAGV